MNEAPVFYKLPVNNEREDFFTKCGVELLLMSFRLIKRGSNNGQL